MKEKIERVRKANTKTVCIRLTQEQHEWIKKRALERYGKGMGMSAAIRDLIDNAMKWSK